MYPQGDCRGTLIQVSSPSRALYVILVPLHPLRNVFYCQSIISKLDIIIGPVIYPVYNVVSWIIFYTFWRKKFKSGTLSLLWNVDLS